MKRKYLFRSTLLVASMLAVGSALAQAPEDDSNSFPVSKKKELAIGGKLGRAYFTSAQTPNGNQSHVFYGGGSLTYGVNYKDRLYYGAGVDVEYIDMIEAPVTIPLYAQGRAFLLGDRSNGLFVEARVGYIFGGKKTFPVQEEDPETGMAYQVGSTVRTLSGLYLEAGLGYRIQRFDVFVAYDYRTARYHTSVYPYTPQASESDNRKSMHTVMFGVRYVLF